MNDSRQKLRIDMVIEGLSLKIGSVYCPGLLHLKCIRLGSVRSSHLPFKMY